MNDVLNIGYGETVRYVKRLSGSKNSHGVIRDSWADPVDIAGVGIDVPAATESGPQTAGGGMDRQVVDAVLFMPHGFACSKMDRMIVRGLLYEVQGDVTPVVNFFTGSRFPSPVNVRRIDG